MNSDRLNKVGIQRELHIAWFDQAARLYASGLKKNEARQEIYSYLDNAPGFETTPTVQTKTYIANALIKTWIMPDRDLIALRDTAFRVIQDSPSSRFAVHWSLLGAAYPFWFAVATVIGRLLNLQDQVTQTQVVSRLKEKFGDRQTVSRRARYIIRSFVAWGAIKDSESKGCYEKVAPMVVVEHNLAILMLEAALHAVPEGMCALGLLNNNPALFPFQLPVLSGDYISQCNERIEVIRYGLDEELLKIKNPR